MKFYVISDTHGKIDKALTVYGRLHSIDAIIHLGDMERDAQRISELTDTNVISVKGNNDHFYSNEEFRILETEFGDILLTHGHIQNVKYDLQRLFYKTAELNCKAVFFGHTHIPVFTETNGIYMLNPGSLTYPHDGSSGSYAIANTSEGVFSASIIYYSDIAVNDMKR